MSKLGWFMKLACIVLATGCSSSVPNDALLLRDDFESYAIDTWPSPDWTAVWNATDASTNGIAYDPTDPTNKVLMLYGRQNWSADARQSFSMADDVYIHAKIYNGSETRTPGWGRGSISLLDTRTLFNFYSDGTIRADAGGSVDLGTYQTERWYDITIHYVRSGTKLTITILLDGTKVLDTTFGIGELEAGATTHSLVLNGGSTAMFDDVTVSVVPLSPLSSSAR